MVEQVVAGRISMDDARILPVDSPHERGFVIVDDVETDFIGS